MRARLKILESEGRVEISESGFDMAHLRDSDGFEKFLRSTCLSIWLLALLFLVCRFVD